MSTLPQLDIECAKVIALVGEPVERLVTAGDADNPDEYEINVTLELKLFDRDDVEIIREMVRRNSLIGMITDD